MGATLESPFQWVDEPMMFQDRAAAALLLARNLAEYRGQNPLILAIPRGAVPMGETIARQLGGELDIALVHKIGAPSNPEFAIGAVSESGDIIESEGFSHASEKIIQQLAQSEISALKKKRECYSPFASPVDPEGRVVILVDDGIATGHTMRAAVELIRRRKPKKIIVCSPVASPAAVTQLGRIADQVVILYAPLSFHSVGQFYKEFPQVTDEEVVRSLKMRRR